MFAAKRISYQKINAFTPIILDYLNGAESLQPFYTKLPSIEAISKAIDQKKMQTINRAVLVNALCEQYATIENEEVQANIKSLLSTDTFTITTAHQPNLFTGPLYFIYKILHTIKLANTLNSELPQYHFVPVFYMGSEDADLAELNHFTIENKKYEWKTAQTGAVGKMLIDNELIQLINELSGQLNIHPFGHSWIQLLKDNFHIGSTIQHATFELVHQLFSKYGLIILIADHPSLKQLMTPIFENDLFSHDVSEIVTNTSSRLSELYKSQAHAREINLFYLAGGIRERIEKQGSEFIVCNTPIRFNEVELRKELQQHPERFSPNVILRGLYQETILPNVTFIGGGGELAYWLQLKEVFQNFSVPFPLLVLRNSFLIIENKWVERLKNIGLTKADLFRDVENLMNEWVQQKSNQQLSLNGKFELANSLFQSIQEQAVSIDPTLVQHVLALKKQAVQKLKELEKKMLRAEKRKFADTQNQLNSIKQALFPKGGLQERVENIGYYYSKWGSGFIDELYDHSLGLEHEFTIIEELKN